MTTRYLLPHRFKRIGWILLIPSAILGIMTLANEWEPAFLNSKVLAVFTEELFGGNARMVQIIENNILDEILGVLIIVSAIMVAFSREKDEDELISSIRLRSLVWATYVNYAVLLLAFLLVYDISFFWVMVFNMFTLLIFFIVKFNLSLHHLRKAAMYEE